MEVLKIPLIIIVLIWIIIQFIPIKKKGFDLNEEHVRDLLERHELINLPHAEILKKLIEIAKYDSPYSNMDRLIAKQLLDSQR